MTAKVSTQPETDESPLPTELAEVFRRIGSHDVRPETLQQGFRIIAETFDAGDVDIRPKDLYQSEPTRHEVVVDGTVEYVPCVLDAMIVALGHEQRPVEIRSESPDCGEVVRFRVGWDEIQVTPDGAVVSFGLGNRDPGEANPRTVKEQIDDGSTIPNSCSVINAFPNSEAYSRWAEDVSGAAVMELDVEEMVAIARDVA